MSEINLIDLMCQVLEEVKIARIAQYVWDKLLYLVRFF